MLKKVKETLVFVMLLLSTINLFGEIRYVSKTGGNPAPPYTTWATASDSLQKCFDYCQSGDTVYVDRGIYRETIYIKNKKLTIIGIDTDECMIDGTGINGRKNKFVLCHFENSEISMINITFLKKTFEESVHYNALYFQHSYCVVNNCIIDSTYTGLVLENGGIINNTIIKRGIKGVVAGIYDNYYYEIKNCVINILNTGDYPKGIFNLDNNCQYTITDNILITEPSPNGYYAMELSTNKKIIIRNNLIYGFKYGMGLFSLPGTELDTTFVVNNTILKSAYYGIEIGNLPKPFVIKNNIFAHNYKGVWSYGEQGDVDYNLFYDNTYLHYQNLPLGPNDITADPMFYNDTAALLGGTYDYRLQKYSPAIDRGDPALIDVDGTRSDIGMYGGTFGTAYNYLDLAPKQVKNLRAVYQQDTNRVKLTWNKNTEADFKQYNIYKDIKANFTIDSTKRIAVTTQPIFYDTLNKGTQKVYYKITAIDSTGNQGVNSTEVIVTITENEEVTITENMDYALYQNYPNPFNPSTTISYSLKEPGEVRIKLYTVTGELIKTVVEGTKNKGYNETKIDMSSYTSGIYLYRLEVTGAGKIPVFNDLKKMVFLK